MRKCEMNSGGMDGGIMVVVGVVELDPFEI